MSASVCKAGCISERVLSIGSRQGIRDGLEGQHDWERIVKQSDSAEMLVPSSGALILGVDREGNSSASTATDNARLSAASRSSPPNPLPWNELTANRPRRNTGTLYRPSPRVVHGDTLVNSIAPGLIV